MNYFARCRIERQARHLLKTAAHVRCMREDVSSAIALQRLRESERKVAELLAAKHYKDMDAAFQKLGEAIQGVCPPRPHSALRENVEILVVALAVAMAFRTYFIQPFKIPTSSMSPTLKGIHYHGQDYKTFSDYFPVNLVKLAVFGQRYIEVKALSSGNAVISPTSDGGCNIKIGALEHKIEPNLKLHIGQNEPAIRGQLLASGLKVAGDHIFVNKIKWNFLPPRRGEIMVFKTDGILHPQIKSNEDYVKRLVGQPGDVLGIVTPYLYINGTIVHGIKMMDKIQSCTDGYNGYIQAGNLMTGSVSSVKLTDGQYYACGDNQRSSLDSRYWGPVPKGNLVGPAFFVYWPLSANWGPAR